MSRPRTGGGYPYRSCRTWPSEASAGRSLLDAKNDALGRPVGPFALTKIKNNELRAGALQLRYLLWFSSLALIVFMILSGYSTSYIKLVIIGVIVFNVFIKYVQNGLFINI